MKLSTKGRYALRVLIDLAMHKDDGFISLNEVSKRHGISKNYLDQIMMLLKSENYLITAKGKLGGYKLAKNASEYTVGDLLRITEGDIRPKFCQNYLTGKCDNSEACVASNVWVELGNVISDYLDNLTFQDVIENHFQQVRERSEKE